MQQTLRRKSGWASAARREPRQLVVTRPIRGRTILVGDAPITIGRHPAADVVLDDLTVSLRHVEVDRLGDAVRVTDLGSLNGIYVNGSRVVSAELAPGDELRVGRFRLRLWPASIEEAV